MVTLDEVAQLDRPIGKLGNDVYYESSGTYKKRAYVKPVQPGTPAQLAWWAKFRTGVTNWQSLTIPQKTIWNESAKPEKMSGFNLYMRTHLNNP